jgi:hypothetical protein
MLFGVLQHSFNVDDSDDGMLGGQLKKEVSIGFSFLLVWSYYSVFINVGHLVKDILPVRDGEGGEEVLGIFSRA